MTKRRGYTQRPFQRRMNWSTPSFCVESVFEHLPTAHIRSVSLLRSIQPCSSGLMSPPRHLSEQRRAETSTVLCPIHRQPSQSRILRLNLRSTAWPSQYLPARLWATLPAVQASEHMSACESCKCCRRADVQTCRRPVHAPPRRWSSGLLPNFRLSAPRAPAQTWREP